LCLLDANFVCVAVHLLLLPTPSTKRWSGPHLLGMMFQQVGLQKLLGRTRDYFCRSRNHCRGGYLAGASSALGLCDPATGNDYCVCKTVSAAPWSYRIICSFDLFDDVPDSALLGLRLLWGWMSQSLSRLLQPPSRQPSRRTRRCPTHHLPSPSNLNPVLVVVNKSRPPMPLLRMAQVSV
jgi:hypothetical protein